MLPHLNTNKVFSSTHLKAALSVGAALAVSLFAARLLLRSKKRKKITRIIDTIEEFHKPTVRMKDPEKVERLVCELIQGGAAKLQVISDFDYTISRKHYHGARCDTTYTLIENSPLIAEDEKQEAAALHNKYYPIEIDPKMSLEEKIPHMVEWYSRSLSIMVNSGITKDSIEQLVKSGNALLRDGCDMLFENLCTHGIPILVFSAGLGDMLEEILREARCLYPNMKIVSNYMEFDKEGQVVGMKGELIHMYNKNEAGAKVSEYYKQVEERHNIILLGDNVGDLGMIKGVKNPHTVLRIGFLNDKIEDRIQEYLKRFDIVLVDDQSMDILNGLLRRVI